MHHNKHKSSGSRIIHSAYLNTSVIFIVTNSKPITSACDKIAVFHQKKKNPSSGPTASACEDKIQSGHVLSPALPRKLRGEINTEKGG
jgi:hypothetical protein